MARRGDNPIGELFVLLTLTIEESRSSGGRYQYQQVVVHNLIEEFGLKTVAIVQISPCARFLLNNRSIPLPRIPTGLIDRPVLPGEAQPLGQCVHLGYVSDFLIIRGVPQYTTFVRKYCHQWQQDSSLVENFLAQITNRAAFYDIHH
jgi:hypothetical protein